MKISKSQFWVNYHLVIVLFCALYTYVMKFASPHGAFSIYGLITFATVLFNAITLGYIAIYLVNRGQKYTHQQVSKYVLPGVFVFFVLTGLIANISVVGATYAGFVIDNRPMDQFFSHLIDYELPYANKNIWTWLVLSSVCFFFVLWKKATKREQLLIEENMRHKYDVLRQQVNPHFLFNSLNTLSELVYQDADRANNYILNLSDIYRYVLENDKCEKVSLAKELKFVRQFVALYQEREPNKIVLDVQLDERADIEVLPVSIQMLVDNAIKHNQKSVEAPLVIKITMSDGKIVVTNPIQLKSILEKSTQTGLNNLKRRWKLSTGKEANVSDKNGIFTVELPIA